MKTRIECRWKEGMSFEAEVNDHIIMLDADEVAGGQNLGPRPKPLTLVSLAGCTGMDVISILRKMRIEPDYFNVAVEGELTEEHPKYYRHIHIIYYFRGRGLSRESIAKAIELSQEKYCGVSALLRKGTEITHEINIAEE